jgi:hypothetical protein
MNLTARYVQMGRLDEAREIVAKLRAITPQIVPSALLPQPRGPRAVPVQVSRTPA